MADFENADSSWLSSTLPRGNRLPSLLGSSQSCSPRGANQDRVSINSCPGTLAHKGRKDAKKSFTKAMMSVLSRGQVSCRELGPHDCAGWLWKKWEESGIFFWSKWQRFWFVLKGPWLCWYNRPQDKKPLDWINIASSSIESAGEHKRKYVFRMCHPQDLDYFFAAGSASEMSEWINCLITAMEKHRFTDTYTEEEFDSEMESESEGSPSPTRRNKHVQKVQSYTLPRLPTMASKLPSMSLAAGSSKAAGGGSPVDEMGMMMNNIKEGRVSLMGHNFRKVLVRRNKKPTAEENVQRLRTMRAFQAELQQINTLLDEPELTSASFSQWKEHYKELLQDSQQQAALGASEAAGDASADAVAAPDTPSDGVASETVAEETGCHAV